MERPRFTTARIRAGFTAIAMSLTIAATHEQPNCGSHSFTDIGRILIPQEYDALAARVGSSATLSFPYMSYSPNPPDFYVQSFTTGMDKNGNFISVYPVVDSNKLLEQKPNIHHGDVIELTGEVFACNYPAGTLYVNAGSLNKSDILLSQ